MQKQSRLPISSLLLALCTLVGLPAFAQDEDPNPYTRSGPYVGGTILGGSYLSHTDDLADDVTALIDDTTSRNLEQDPSLGFDLYAGYRLNAYFAVEAEFEMLPSSDIDYSEDIEEAEAVIFPPSPAQTGTSGTVAEIESLTGTLNFKAFLPLGRFQPFALAGVGVADIERQDASNLSVWVSETEVVGRFGGGADVYVTEHVVLHFSVEYVLPGASLQDFDYMSYGGGIQYRF
ncbi:MAG: outer membrane beta-barrel protein [Myxococcota bacterium]